MRLVISAVIALGVASCAGRTCDRVAIAYRITMTRVLDVAPGEVSSDDAQVCIAGHCVTGRAPAVGGEAVESGHQATLALTPTSDGRTELRLEVVARERETPTTIEVRLSRTSGDPVTASGVVEWRDRDEDGCHTEPVSRGT